MIGLDTNVLVRYLTQDDAAQSARASALIEGQLSSAEPGFVTLITLVELSWVLESCYRQGRDIVLGVLHDLLTTKQLVVDQAEAALLAVKRCRACPNGVDFSDALIAVLSELRGCSRIVTFDKKAQLVGMEPL